MAKDPAFLFYSSDFLSGVSDLTMEERGQYITLLCVQHQKGSLSEKTIRLLVGSVSVDVMSKFLQETDGTFFNKRLREEIILRNNFTESRRNNGLQGGRPKKNNKPNDKPKQNHMDNHMEDENINENKDINTDKGGAGGILGEMQKLFLSKNQDYKFTPDDLSSIREVGCWLGDNKDIMQCDHTKILTDWETMLKNIEGNDHWKTYTLQQVFKFRAAIFSYKPKVLQMNAIIPKNKFEGRGGIQKYE